MGSSAVEERRTRPDQDAVLLRYGSPGNRFIYFFRFASEIKLDRSLPMMVEFAKNHNSDDESLESCIVNDAKLSACWEEVQRYINVTEEICVKLCLRALIYTSL